MFGSYSVTETVSEDRELDDVPGVVAVVFDVWTKNQSVAEFLNQTIGFDFLVRCDQLAGLLENDGQHQQDVELSVQKTLSGITVMLKAAYLRGHGTQSFGQMLS